MIPVIGGRYRAIGQSLIVKVVQTFEDKSVEISAVEGDMVNRVPYQRFVEYWEPEPDEAVAP